MIINILNCGIIVILKLTDGIKHNDSCRCVFKNDEHICIQKNTTDMLDRLCCFWCILCCDFQEGSHRYTSYEFVSLNKLLKDIEFEIENAQENYANLDWISKEQAIFIINIVAKQQGIGEELGE